MELSFGMDPGDRERDLGDENYRLRAELNAEIAELVEYAKGLRKALIHITSNTTPEGAGQRLLWIEAEAALAKPMPKGMQDEK